MNDKNTWVRYAKQLISLADEKNIDISKVNRNNKAEAELIQSKFQEFADFGDKTFESILLEAQKMIKSL